MENHLHHHHHSKQPDPDPYPILDAFQHEVSSSLDCLLVFPSSNPDSGQFPSLSWVKQCFGILQSMNGAFTKLAVEMDHSVSGWDADSVESYLSYSLNLLELFNSISSSLSHLGQSRLSLSHALSLLDNSPSSAAERLAPIQPQQVEEAKPKELGTAPRSVVSHGKHLVIHKALRLMEGVGYWVCGAVLSALSSDPKAYVQAKRWALECRSSSLVRVDSGVHEVILQKGSVCVLRDVEGINETLACLVAALQVQGGEEERKSYADAAEELQSKLKGFEKLIEEINGGVDDLFSEILRSRNEVIDCLRST